jgi:hypothetical protein
MWGDDVMLLSMDGTGAMTVARALDRCAQAGSAQLIDNARLYTFVVEPGAAHLEITGRRSVWRLDGGKVAELLHRVHALQRTDRADIGGIDIQAPTDTLLLWRRRSAYETLPVRECNGYASEYVVAESGW